MVPILNISDKQFSILAREFADASLLEVEVAVPDRKKAVSLEKRAEAIYPEYRRQKASAAGGRAFRLPL